MATTSMTFLFLVEEEGFAVVQNALDGVDFKEFHLIRKEVFLVIYL